MNVQINEMLGQIRAKLAGISLVEADAGEVDVDVPGDSVAGQSKAGTGGAENISDVEDILDMYLSGLVDRLMHKYDVSDEDAADVVFACIDKLVADGVISELPPEDSEERDVAAWVGRATTSGLPKHLDDFAKDLETDDAEEDEESED